MLITNSGLTSIVKPIVRIFPHFPPTLIIGSVPIALQTFSISEFPINSKQYVHRIQSLASSSYLTSTKSRAAVGHRASSVTVRTLIVFGYIGCGDRFCRFVCRRTLTHARRQTCFKRLDELHGYY